MSCNPGSLDTEVGGVMRGMYAPAATVNGPGRFRVRSKNVVKHRMWRVTWDNRSVVTGQWGGASPNTSGNPELAQVTVRARSDDGSENLKEPQTDMGQRSATRVRGRCNDGVVATDMSMVYFWAESFKHHI